VNSTKRNIVANYVGQGWSALMGVAFIPVYVNCLGVESFGLVGVFTLILAALGPLEAFASPLLAREMARLRGGAHDANSIRTLLRSVEIFCACFLGLAVLVFWSATPWLADWWLNANQLPKETVIHALVAMGMVAVLKVFENIYRSCLSGLQMQVALNGALIVVATLRGAGAAVLVAWVSPDIRSFFLWNACVSIFSVGTFAYLVYFILPKNSKRAAFSWVSLISVSRFSGGMALLFLLAFGIGQTDKLVLTKMLTLEEFGFYALASAIAGILSLLAGPIVQVFGPKMNEMIASGGSGLAQIYHQGSKMVSVSAGSAGILIIFFPEAILDVWIGNGSTVKESAPFLRILAAGNLLNAMMHMPGALMFAHGWTSLALKANFLAVGAIIPCMIWGVINYGPKGAAFAWLFLNAGYILFVIHFMHKKLLLEEKIRWYLYDTLVPLLAGIVAAIILRQFLKPLDFYFGKVLWLFAVAFFIFCSCAAAAILIVPKKSHLITRNNPN